MAEVPECLLPGLGMEVHRVDQRPVDIEDDRLDHVTPRQSRPAPPRDWRAGLQPITHATPGPGPGGRSRRGKIDPGCTGGSGGSRSAFNKVGTIAGGMIKGPPCASRRHSTPVARPGARHPTAVPRASCARREMRTRDECGTSRAARYGAATRQAGARATLRRTRLRGRR